MKYQHDKELIDKTREILEKGSGKIDESLFPGFTLDIADDDKKKEDFVRNLDRLFTITQVNARSVSQLKSLKNTV